VATFVLVPGGWRGGWWFEPLVTRLRAHGHDARAVTLTGLGDRAHLATARTNLDTHIEDVLRLLECERLTDVVLCAHSYGGMVITGVADRAPERLAALVYCDAYVPEDGQSCFDLAGDRYRSAFLTGARADGHSVVAPPGSDPRTSAQPLASFLQQVRLTGAWQRVRRREFLYLSDWATPFTAQYQRLAADPTWVTHTLPIGHDVMTHGLDELTATLLAVAGPGPA
jgi:pimeloyl-ACP methyl ester carboxylesterase